MSIDKPSDRIRASCFPHPTKGELFDEVRMWAYRNRRHYDDQGGWEQAVHEHATAVNAEFASRFAGVFIEDRPGGFYADYEISNVAKSVAQWVWANISPDEIEASPEASPA